MIPSKVGFTLFEMLVSISVIAIVSTVTVFSFNVGVEKQALASASSQLNAMLRAARGQAILNGTDARLIINFDNSDQDKFLRFVGIVIQDKDDSTMWEAVSKGAFLPQGIYFVPQGNKVGFDSSWSSISPGDQLSEYRSTNGSTTSDAVMKLPYPEIGALKADQAGDPEWICYQFAPNGELDYAVINGSGGGIPPFSNHIVIAAGKKDNAGKIVFSDNFSVKGIKFKRNGHTYAVDEVSVL
ncbi:prepilin-type N-terminal cleavage/methylation domain-containing protein [Puniceicoccaceae bacterium K14]|nr:prepilin-type N-terminal cleavage/methylation domain-containing protein [Puniceicoccaceae bacterium K14]